MRLCSDVTKAPSETGVAESMDSNDIPVSITPLPQTTVPQTPHRSTTPINEQGTNQTQISAVSSMESTMTLDEFAPEISQESFTEAMGIAPTLVDNSENNLNLQHPTNQ